MKLDATDLRTFMDNGVIIKRGFVPARLIHRAQSLVMGWYFAEMNQRQLAEYTQRTFAPDLSSHDDMLALFTESGANELVHDLIGDFVPVSKTQVQIRVPEADLTHVQPHKPMHVDGVGCPHLDPAELRTFSLLIGIVLSDISDPEVGALRYIPGGHLRMAEWFRTEWSIGLTDQVPPHLESEHGTSFLGKPGDLLLMHHLVPHAVGHNRTAKPRIMAYFRVSHIDHATRRLEALRDPWLDFPALTANAR